MRGPRPCANSTQGYEAAVIGDVIAITVFAFTGSAAPPAPDHVPGRGADRRLRPRATKAVPVRIGSALTHSLASPAGLTRGSIRFARGFLQKRRWIAGSSPAMTKERPCQPSCIHSNGNRFSVIRHTGIARWRGLSSLIPIDRNATRAREGFTMDMDRDISRRHMLALSAAAGGVWRFGGGMAAPSRRARSASSSSRRSWTRSSRPPSRSRTSPTASAAPQGPAEGPLWWKEGGYLLFSDIHNNRRMKYEPGKGASLFLEPTNRANGLTRDLQGRLVACEHDTPPRHAAASSTAASPSSPTASRAASSTGRMTWSSSPTAASISPIRGPAPPRPSSGT